MAYMKQGQWQDSGEASELEHIDTFANFSTLEKGRFHLYVSYGCPFAHRAILAISLLGLKEYVSVSSVSPLKDKNGWKFSDEYFDSVKPRSYLYQVYQDAKHDYSGRVSVPVLWDKKLNTIVSSDSFEISKWFAKQDVSRSRLDLMPEKQEVEIEEQCRWINTNINTLPFKAGFTTEQIEYEQAASEFFSNLEVLDKKLAKNRFFGGKEMTLSDVLLIPTLIQLELVYASHFKLNYQPLNYFKHIYRYVIDVMSDKSVRSTFHIDFIKKTYFAGQSAINPSLLIPTGPVLGWELTAKKALHFERSNMEDG